MSLDVRFHRDLRRFFVYVAASPDLDGVPQCYAIELTAAETVLWLRGEKDFLAKQLRLRGVPLPEGRGPEKITRFRKIVRSLWGLLGQ